MKAFTGSRFWWVIILMVILLPIMGCKKEVTPEEKAQEIAQKAKALWDAGNTLEALSEYDKLMEYSGTPAFTEAEAFVKSEGYTLGQGWVSWTIRKMFEIENEILSQRPEDMPIKGTTVKYPTKDAWGNYFNIEYADYDRYAFLLLSAGPDGEFGTPDDLSLPHNIHSQQASETPQTDAAAATPAAPAAPEETMYDRVPPGKQYMKEVLDKAKPAPEPTAPSSPPPASQAGPPSGPTRMPPTTIGPTGERTVDLKDLLEFKEQGK